MAKGIFNSGSSGKCITVWNSTVTYSVGEACYYSGKFYKSLLSGNINNTPDTALAYWQSINVGGGVGQNVSGIYSSDALTIDELVSLSNIDVSLIQAEMPNYKVSTRQLVLLLHMDGDENSSDFLDDRSNPKYIQAIGNARIGCIPTTPMGTGMIKFNGSEALTIPDSDTFWFGSNNYLIECYIQLDDISTSTSDYKCIIAQRTSVSSNYSFALYIKGGTPNQLYATFSTSGTNEGVAAWNYPFKAKVTYHVATVRVGAYLYGFVNGILIGCTSVVSNILFNSTAVVSIGASNAATTHFFNGFIQELRVMNGTVPYSVTKDIPTTEGIVDGNTKLLLHMNGSDGGTSLTDDVGNSVTLYGNTCTKTSYSMFGGSSTYFDGTGDYISIPNSSELQLGQDDFSIDFWAYFTSLSSPKTVFSKRSSSSAFDGYCLSFYTTGNLAFDASTNGTSMNVHLVNTVDVVVNSWYHIAIVRHGDSFVMYLNGIPVSATIVSGKIVDSNCDLFIGYGVGLGYHSGYLDEFRIKKGTQIWNSTFTPPTQPLDSSIVGTSLLIHGNGETGASITDISTNNHVITKVGNPYVWNKISKFTNISAYFDGASYLKVNDNNDFNLGTNNFTMDCWINLSKLPVVGSYSTICSQRYNNASYESFTLYVYNNAGAAQLRYQYTTTGSTLVVGSSDFTIVPQVWYHVAVVRNGTYIYVFGNGQKVATLTIGATSVIYNSSYPFFIGAAQNVSGLSYYFCGFIDEFRFINGEAMWTEAFTPSTVEYVTE